MFNLDDIICFFSNCIVELTFIFCFKKLNFNQEKKYLKYISLIPCFSLLITLEFHFGIEAISTITSLLSYFTLYFLIFRRNAKETFFYGMAIYIIALMIDIFTMFSISVISKIFPNLISLSWNIVTYCNNVIKIHSQY